MSERATGVANSSNNNVAPQRLREGRANAGRPLATLWAMFMTRCPRKSALLRKRAARSGLGFRLPCLGRRLPIPSLGVLLFAWFAATGHAATPAASAALPGKMRCQAIQTAGLHDYAGAPESYEASTFFESKFDLRINKVLTRHLAGSNPGMAEATPDLFLTMLPSPSSQGNVSPVELRCRQVQGQSKELGYSCSNTPPSELLLINPANLRFTRASIGGWTFSDSPAGSANPGAAGPDDATADEDSYQPATSGEHLGNDSLFVEFGNCTRR